MPIGLADVLRRHGPAYLERFSGSLLPSHDKALRDIQQCRTPLLGGHVAECSHCGCELLSVLFLAAFQSLAELCADPHFLGAQIGALAVLHTWTRTLEWHPHIHMLVPGGGLAPDGRTWLRAPRRRKRFLVPVEALAKRFRG